MIVKFENFETKKEDFKKQILFLFYGTNLGKVEDCTNSIINLKKKIHNIEVVSLHSEELKKGEISKILEENCSLNLFGNHILLTLYINNDKIGKEVVSAISSLDISNLTIVIKSDQLSPKSVLRTFFESSENAVCIPCYEENSKEKVLFIKNYLKKESIELNISELTMLSDSLPNQRLEIKNELEKIIIICKNSSNNNSFDFFLSHISESMNRDQSKFIFSISSKQTKNFTHNYNLFTDFGNDSIKLVSYLLEHFFRLLLVKKKLNEGLNIKEAMKQLKPPVFFKDITIFEKQVSDLTFREINGMIKNLFRCKRNLINGTWSSSFSVLYTLLGFFRQGFSSKNL